MKAVPAVLLFAALTGAATCLFKRKNIFVNDLVTWADAQAYCRTYYVDLTTINSVEEITNFIVDAGVNAAGQSWIGLSRSLQLHDAYTYQWSDGSKVEFTVWNPGEPKSLSTSLCVIVYNSAFAVQKCSERMKFFCYKWVPEMNIVNEMMNWDKALEYCRMHYTDLISLANQNDLLLLKKMTNTTSVWTGLHFTDGVWFWVNNETLGTLTLVPSCPIKPFHCGALKAGGSVLDNRNCNEKLAFICYL